MRKIKTKINLEEGCSIHPSLPTYKSKDAAGCDLCYCGEIPITLYTLDRVTIHTGIHIQLPEEYEAQVRGRSGLNRDHGIVVPTGTIDADYRGDIGVVVYNLSREPKRLLPGKRRRGLCWGGLKEGKRVNQNINSIPKGLSLRN